MPKRTKVTGPGVKPDSKYGSPLASKFINAIMRRGKKSTAEHVFYDALAIITKKMPGTDPLEVFTQAIENVKPVVEVKSRRVGGATYQVPIEVSRRRRQSLAFRWIIQAARSRKGRPMAERLAAEFMNAHKREGDSIKKREDTHRMAEANKAFAHFAW
jgi:small subunit ribosomal protein S7